MKKNAECEKLQKITGLVPSANKWSGGKTEKEQTYRIIELNEHSQV